MFGRRRSWPILRYFLRVLFGEMEKHHEKTTIRIDNFGLRIELGPPE
jgi:hypothetical protein